VDKKILGIIGSLGQVSKRELDAVMSIVQIDAEFGRNAAQRLVLAQLIYDTGNHYLPRDSTACDLAATEVEDLMIELVRQGWLCRGVGAEAARPPRLVGVVGR